jgi:hypothetical protein
MTVANQEQPCKNSGDNLVAIDILLEPDQTMISKSREVNARLRENFPAGYELDAPPVLVREPKLDFIDDYEGKPARINKFIGRRPIATFGKSVGDFQMLEWVTGGTGPHFCLLVHHDDAVREFVYDRHQQPVNLTAALTKRPNAGGLW